MPAAGAASTSSSRASRPSALVVRARTQILEPGRAPKESRVGKVPIPIPAGSTVTLEEAYIKVKVRSFDSTKAGCETDEEDENKKRERGDAGVGDCERTPLTALPRLFATANPPFIHRDPRASSSSTTLTSSRSKR